MTVILVTDVYQSHSNKTFFNVVKVVHYEQLQDIGALTITVSLDQTPFDALLRAQFLYLSTSPHSIS